MTNPRHNDDGIWTALPTGGMIFDDWHDEMVPEMDYVLDGSEELSPWELMVYRAMNLDVPAFYSDRIDSFTL